MKVIFRADASLQIGSGHIMRCLTQADVLKNLGAECRFICREHTGNMIQAIRSRGYRVHTLACHEKASSVDGQRRGELAHAHWLGSSQREDASSCLTIIKGFSPDWLIVDHYALDVLWESALRPYSRRLMVIDDLADREHDCDLLLDQNLGRQARDYTGLLQNKCRLLTGPKYALLRPEFVALRDYSLNRRANPQLRKLLISMGGIDKDNVTGRVLETLKNCALSDDCQISVVMGATAPWLNEVRMQIADMPWSTEVLVNVGDMARLMADSDLSIGAAGGTSWERCCMGLPALMVVLAQNQWPGARALQAARAVGLLGEPNDIDSQLPQAFDTLLQGSALGEMSNSARLITDGLGAKRVSQELE